jgi:hypothetical protein
VTERFDSLRELVRTTLATIGGELEALKNEAMPQLEPESPVPAGGEAQSVIPDRKTGREVAPAQAHGRMPARSERKRQPTAAPTVARSSPPTDAGGKAYADELLATIAAYGPLSRTRLSILSGKSKASSTFAGAIRTLIGLADITDEAGLLEATARGKKRAGLPQLSRGRAVLDHHVAALGDYDAATLRVVLDNRRAGVTRAQIATATGHSPASSTFAASVRRLKKLGLAEERDRVIKLSDDSRFAFGMGL